MGKYFIDKWSLGHFVGGVFGRISIYPHNAKMSFIITTGFHLLVELLEQNPHPISKGEETFQNSVGDMVFFILGWIVAEMFINKYISDTYRPIFIIWFVIFSLNEFLREIVIVEHPSMRWFY